MRIAHLDKDGKVINISVGELRNTKPLPGERLKDVTGLPVGKGWKEHPSRGFICEIERPEYQTDRNGNIVQDAVTGEPVVLGKKRVEIRIKRKTRGETQTNPHTGLAEVEEVELGSVS